MEVVVNTRLLLRDRLEGIGWFTYQTLRRIVRDHPEVHFIFLFDRPYDESFVMGPNVTPLIIGPQARHPLLYYVWLQLSVKPLLRKLKPDVFLSPDGLLVLGAKCPQVAVIHDINFLHNPGHSKWLTARYYNFFFPRFARIASRIATVSQFSKKELVKHYGVSPGRIDVVYNGVNEFFAPLNEAGKAAIRATHTRGEKYFIYVGSIHPRKNLENLVRAYVLFRKSTGSSMLLVIAGPAFWGNGRLAQVIRTSGFEKDILLTGRLPDEQLGKLVAAAEALTFVPFYEGFGIPVIEAMASGTPVITSNTSSLPEVAGDAALLADPSNADSICDAMCRVVEPGIARQLAKAGIQRAEMYSWEKTAHLLWRCVDQAVEKASG